jgi:putative SOS response-associated peptidase YedK
VVQHPQEIVDMLTPCDDTFLTRREVGAYVNNARHEDETCMVPVKALF